MSKEMVMRSNKWVVAVILVAVIILIIILSQTGTLGLTSLGFGSDPTDSICHCFIKYAPDLSMGKNTVKSNVSDLTYGQLLKLSKCVKKQRQGIDT